MTPPWLTKEEYPFESRYFPVNGHKLHYIEEGEGETILFVHGTPSWSFDFRQLIKVLRGCYRCIAIDHMGFGLSDKPAHYDYSTINHSKTLEKFIAWKHLESFTMVVHDFGGPIGLQVAMKYPAHIARLVILNSWLWSSKTDPQFIRLSKWLKSPLLPFLYRYLNFSPKFLLPGSFGETKLPASVKKYYTRPFAGKSQRNGPLAFARSLLHDQDWFEELWEERHSISHIPALFIWGMKDPLLGPAYLEKFASGFPCAQVKKLDTCGHFPQEEQPRQVTGYLQEFMAMPASLQADPFSHSFCRKYPF